MHAIYPPADYRVHKRHSDSGDDLGFTIERYRQIVRSMLHFAQALCRFRSPNFELVPFVACTDNFDFADDAMNASKSCIATATGTDGIESGRDFSSCGLRRWDSSLLIDHAIRHESRSSKATTPR